MAYTSSGDLDFTPAGYTPSGELNFTAGVLAYELQVAATGVSLPTVTAAARLTYAPLIALHVAALIDTVPTVLPSMSLGHEKPIRTLVISATAQNSDISPNVILVAYPPKILSISALATIPAASIDCTLSYDSNVWRGMVTMTTMRFKRGINSGVGAADIVPGPRTTIKSAAIASIKTTSVSTSKDILSVWPINTHSTAANIKWSDGVGCGISPISRWDGGMQKRGATIAERNTAPASRTGNSQMMYRHLVQKPASVKDLWPGRMFVASSVRDIHLPRRAITFHVPARALFIRSLHGYARLYIPPTQPATTTTGDLNFICYDTREGVLNFGPHSCIRFVPTKRSYIVYNNFSLVLLSDGTPLTPVSFNASISYDSWAWSWSATIPGSELPLVMGNNPVELVATVNGISFVLITERLSRSRTYDKSTVKISGRGRTAWLGAPYAVAESRSNATGSLTANQIAESVLLINGQPFGWSIDWGLDDWLVPSGDWLHHGTYIEALNTIAAAGGGYLKPHKYNKEIAINKVYPVPSWELDSTTPDIILPDAVATVEDIEWSEIPAYDHVYVSGPRTDRIVRTGSGAQLAAPTVVDDLATDVIMTRYRGIKVLSEAGKKAKVTLSLPVLPSTGILETGDLVQYPVNGTNKIGIVRDVAVSVAFPAIKQAITLEFAV